MQSRWQPRKLQFYLTGPLLGLGFITLLFLSWFCMGQSSLFLRAMTQESSARALNLALHTVSVWEPGQASSPRTQLQLQQLFGKSGATVFILDPDALLLAYSPFANARLYQNENHRQNAFEHQDCLLRCTVQTAQDLFGPLNLLEREEYFPVRSKRAAFHAAIARVHDHIIVVVSEEQNYSGYLNNSTISLLLGLFILLLTVLLFHRIMIWQVTLPILQLNDAAAGLEERDWHDFVTFARNDEIGQLTRSVGGMARRFKDSLRDLENQLERRTADLKDIIEKYAAANQALERTNATKDRIFSIIAHDLKSPFNALKGYSGIISDSFDSLHQNQLREMIDKISVSAEEAHGLLENLLQWALVQAGGMRVKWENHNLREIVLEVFDLMKVNAKVKGLRLDIQLSPELWVNADRMMVATVVRNLVANAVKFTRSDEGYILCRASEDRDRILMMIEDNGVGISSTHIDKLFQRDAWFTEKGTRDERGTGLGLGLCREFITLNEGKLEVESQIGKGTRLFISWKRGQAPRLDPQEGFDRQLNILFVDDSEDNHDLVRIYLKPFPWRVSFAENGQIGLDSYQKGRFDMVLMDLNMPVMGGIEATQAIRAYEQAEHLPRAVVIAFTSSVLQTDIDAAIQAGCDAYLIKPIKKQNLVNIITRLMKNVKVRVDRPLL